MVKRKEKTMADLVKDLAGMGIKAERDAMLDILKAPGLAIKKGKQGTCVINCNGGDKYPNLYFRNYGVNMTQMGDSHYIVPILK
ncbi:MAG: hypothetical protein Q8M92_02270 [Candidatus Subteraquimicrobiales bacterium]|nr:hypothetical protein [Candidatus Subteraquimicrobiales bacterium]